MSSRQALFDASLDYFLRPIAEFLSDNTVTEIMVNGHERIYIERRGRIEPTTASFTSEDALLSAIHNIAQSVGREIDEHRPVLDARLPNGSRVHAIIPPSATRGIYLTIRKFSWDSLALEDLVRYGSLSAEAREFLEICVRLKKNILISGGTGTGKTSLLNALATAIPSEERIIVIEDTSELRLRQPHALYMEAQAPGPDGRGGMTVRQLFVASLRMRPDRILVGEVRSGEALDLVQSMISGHAGSLSTVHANTSRDALVRLETLSLMSDVEIPVYVARMQVASAIQLIVQLSRFTEDGSRRVTQISEVCGIGPDNQYILHDLFLSRLKGRAADGHLLSSLEPTGTQPTFAKEPYQQGMDDRVKLTTELWVKD